MVVPGTGSGGPVGSLCGVILGWAGGSVTEEARDAET